MFLYSGFFAKKVSLYPNLVRWLGPEPILWLIYKAAVRFMLTTIMSTKLIPCGLALFYNRTERRLRTLWRLLIVIFLGLAGGAIFRLLATSLIVFFLLITLQIPLDVVGRDQALTQAINTVFMRFPLLFGLRSLLVLWIIGGAFVLVARWLDNRHWRDYGFHCTPTWWRDLTFGLCVGVGLMALIFGLEYGCGWVAVNGLFENTQRQLPFWPLWVDSLFATLLVGTQEEWFARGYLLQNLAEGLYGPRSPAKGAVFIAYLLTSLFFGFLHINNPHATLTSSLTLALFGLCVGLGFILTGELAIPIGLHIGWNFAQGAIFGFPVSGADTHLSLLATQQSGPTIWTGGAFGPEGGLLGPLALLLGALMVYGWMRWTGRQVFIQAALARYSQLPHKTKE